MNKQVNVILLESIKPFAPFDISDSYYQAFSFSLNTKESLFQHQKVICRLRLYSVYGGHA